MCLSTAEVDDDRRSSQRSDISAKGNRLRPGGRALILMSYVICRVWESQTQRHVPYQPRMEKGRFKISVFGSDVFISTAALRSVIFFMLLLAAALKIQTDLEITFLPNLNFKHQKIYNKTLAKCSGSEWKKKTNNTSMTLHRLLPFYSSILCPNLNRFTLFTPSVERARRRGRGRREGWRTIWE